MLEGAHGIAHVVQAVEERHQVIARAWIAHCRRDLEADPVADFGSLSSLTSGFDRTVVKSKPTKLEAGKASAMMIVQAPCPQPTSATLAPSESFPSTPESAGIQASTRLAR